MKRLDKGQEAKHAELSGALTKAREELVDAIVDFNEEVSRLHAHLASKVEDFNTAVSEANAFVQDIHSEQEGYFDEKSERWQEGEAGSAYSDWMQEWDVELEDVELEPAPELDEPDFEDVETFENLPTEVNS